jgi:hypothetical protein
MGKRRWQGPGSGLFKTTDGGNTWRQLTKGLPTFEQGLGRIGITVAPSDPNTLYATSIHHSSEGSIVLTTRAKAGNVSARIDDQWARGSDFAEIEVDSAYKEIVYTAAIAAYRSTDGERHGRR